MVDRLLIANCIVRAGLRGPCYAGCTEMQAFSHVNDAFITEREETPRSSLSGHPSKNQKFGEKNEIRSERSTKGYSLDSTQIYQINRRKPRKDDKRIESSQQILERKNGSLK